MVNRVVAAVLAVSMLLWPLYVDRADASVLNMSSVRGVWTLTSGGGGGLEVLQNRVATISRGVSILSMFGRIFTAVTVGLAVLEVASMFWDWYQVTFTPTGTASPFPGGTTVSSWGNLSGSGVYMGGWFPSSCTSTSYAWSSSGNTIGSAFTVVGGKVAADYSSCGNQVGMSPTYQLWLYAATSSAPGGDSVGTSTSTPASPVAGPGDRDALVQEMTQLRDDLKNGLALPSGQGITSNQGTTSLINDLNKAIDALTHPVSVTGSQVTAGPNHSVGDPTIPGNSVPTSTGTGTGSSTSVDLAPTNQKLDDISTKLDATPSTATAVACPSCARIDKWSEFWNTLKTAAMGAPVFGLISKLVINPTGGESVCAVRTITTQHMGTLTVDPSSFSCSTLVAVFRFAILGTCVIVAYMILFG